MTPIACVLYSRGVEELVGVECKLFEGVESLEKDRTMPEMLDTIAR